MRLLAILFAGVCFSMPIAILFLQVLRAFEWRPGFQSFELDAFALVSMAIPIGICFAWHARKAV